MSKIFILAFVFATIIQLSFGIGVNCNFHIVQWTTLGSTYTCDTISLTFDQTNRESITVVNGTHQNGRTNADVLGFRIFNEGLDHFPVNIVRYFPNIRGLDFRDNSISYVNSQHLFPLPNLVDLSLWNNKITSLDSNLFSGHAMQVINFMGNNIAHVGHDFVLPNTLSNGFLDFRNNPCINRRASTPGEITALRISLLENCQPSWLRNVTIQTQSLVNRTDGLEQSHSEMDGKVKSFTNAVAQLENRNSQLMTEVTELRESNVELTSEVRALTNKVTDLQESNVELTNELTDVQNKNSRLETRIGFVDTRAGFLELRVAVLESIIESKLGLKIDDVISGSVN